MEEPNIKRAIDRYTEAVLAAFFAAAEDTLDPRAARRVPDPADERHTTIRQEIAVSRELMVATIRNTP